MRHFMPWVAAMVAFAPLTAGLVGCGNNDDIDAGVGEQMVTAGNATATNSVVAKEDISYDDDTALAFTNNKLLLHGREGADPEEVKVALSQYGDVDDRNASAGMYVLTVDGHLDSHQLATMIEEIVAQEELIDSGSINWSLPDQTTSSDAPPPATTPSRTS